MDYETEFTLKHTPVQKEREEDIHVHTHRHMHLNVALRHSQPTG